MKIMKISAEQSLFKSVFIHPNSGLFRRKINQNLIYKF